MTDWLKEIEEQARLDAFERRIEIVYYFIMIVLAGLLLWVTQ